MLALIAVIFIEVLFRYCFMIPAAWSEELARYLFVALSFLGSSYAYAKHDHIEIDVITQVFEKMKSVKDKEKMHKVFRILAHISTMIFLVIFCDIFFSYWLKIYQINLLSPTMRIPMVAVYFTVLLGCGITIIHGLFMLVREFFYKEEKTN